MAEYIKREELIKRLWVTPILKYGIPTYTRDGVIDLVEKQPAVDVVEVVHGRWILRNTCDPNTEKYHCSVCDKIPRSLCPENYCPNCGARMDGED